MSWKGDSLRHSLSRKRIRTGKKRKKPSDDAIEDMIVAELLPEYKGEDVGDLTVGELKQVYPPLYHKIKHWEELGKGFK